MNSTGKILQMGLSKHRAGRLQAAERAYRAVLDHDRANPDALHLLGLVHHQRGDHRRALSLITKAIGTGRVSASYHNSVGETHRALGDSAAAMAAYREAIRIDESFGDAWNNMGVVLRSLGDRRGALSHFQRAVTLNPKHVHALNNLGVVQIELGKHGQAADTLRRVVEIDPSCVEAHANLGNALRHLGHLEAAETAYRAAIRRGPNSARARNNLGVVLQQLGRLSEAEAAFRLALSLRPTDTSAHNNLGAACFVQGRVQESIAHYQSAINYDPDYADAHENLAAAYLAQSRVNSAIASARRALEAHPHSGKALNVLGNALLQKRDLAAAMEAFEHALVTDDGADEAFWCLVSYMPAIADWAGHARYTRLLEERLTNLQKTDNARRFGHIVPLSFSLPYFSDDTALLGRVLRMAARHIEDRARHVAPNIVFSSQPRGGQLRVGYVSPDFGDHPIGHVTRPIFGLHDRRRFHITCYGLLDRSGESAPYHKDIAAAADRFIDLSGHTLVDAARAIHADQIDILIDLTGNMRYGQPTIFAMRPAPIQVYWLGHGGGLGARYIDYVIADPIVVPDTMRADYVEAVARLPDSFSSADQPPIADQPLSRSDFNLPNEAVVFCAFNNSLKLEPDTFMAWMKILAATPNSVLWLSASDNDVLKQSLRCHAANARIDPGRLVFASRLEDKTLHLARHRLADLFLDSFKFNASTTALDALWAGLPVLTLAGNGFHSRIGASYLRALRMDDMICTTPDEFVRRANVLATNPGQRQMLKSRLESRRKTAPLFQADRFVRHLEWAFEHMWQIRSEGDKPASFDVPVCRTD